MVIIQAWPRIKADVMAQAETLSLRCHFRQTNSEAVMVEWLQEAFIHKREEIYRHSLISTVATGVIAGLGVQGYTLAMQAMARQLRG
jgi:3-dehydroquinate dehydratase-2